MTDATPSDSPSSAPDAPDYDDMTRDIADVPAVEVITTVAVHLLSAAAVNLGLDKPDSEHKDLDEARKLITALAGLVTASATEISSFHAAPLRDVQVAPAGLPRGLDRPGRAGPGPG